MKEFNPIGNVSVDAKSYADFVFYKAIGDLTEKLLADIEESGISAEMARLVPEFLSAAIEDRNKMVLTVRRFSKYPEEKADSQWQQP